MQVDVINWTAAQNPIVPSDEVSSKVIISGVHNLPVDDVRNVISLTPGVVESGAGAGLVIRGGRPGEVNVYIDGAPVRSANGALPGMGMGGSTGSSQAITVGTNAVEEASVTTGALGVEFGDAQAGIISYTTRSGGEKLSGALSGATDEPFGNAISLGFNRFEGSIGGPIPRIADQRLFSGRHVCGRLAVLNWSHTVYKAAEHELAINANVSWGQDRGIAGPLDPATELSTRSPAMGVQFSNLNFAGFGSFPFPITDQIIRNIRTNTGDRTPLLNRTDLRNSQPYRMNPFGMQSGSWITDRMAAFGALSRESRVTGRLHVDWQANRFHRFNFGGDGKHTHH